MAEKSELILFSKEPLTEQERDEFCAILRFRIKKSKSRGKKLILVGVTKKEVNDKRVDKALKGAGIKKKFKRYEFNPI